MRISAQFRGGSIREYMVGLPLKGWQRSEFRNSDDLFNYMNTHHWLPVIHRGPNGVQARALNTRLLTSVRVIDEY